jgi:hypothetical protein
LRRAGPPWFVVAAGALLLAACTGPAYPVAGPVAPPPPVAPPSAVARLETPIPRPAAAAKECGAAALQGLIGRPRTEVPVPLDPGRQRVACTTCPAADNVDPGRLNFLFDAQTGLIREVRCG